MDIFDFVEGTEKKQIQLLKMLQENGAHGCSDHQLRSALNLSINNLNQLLAQTEELLKKQDPDIKITTEDSFANKRIILLPSDSFDFSTIYHRFLRNSKNYQILRTILKRGKCTVLKLSKLLYMSEATLFRRIKKLNLLLKEFSLQIKNGAIVGPESQIRFLAYSLIVAVYSIDELQEYYGETYPIKAFAAFFEKKQHLQISLTGKLHLSIWLDVSFARFAMMDRKKNPLDPAEISSLESSELYRALKNWIFGFLSQYAFRFNDFEVYNIYIFLCSMETVDLANPNVDALENYLQLANQPVDQVNELFLNRIDQYYPLNEENISHLDTIRIKYLITQLHHKVIYFHGTFYLFSGESITRVLNEEIYQRLWRLSVQQMKTTLAVLDLPASEQMREIISRRYFDILIQVHDHSFDRLKIGVLIYDDWPIVAAVISRLRTFLETSYHVKIERAAPSGHYDLLLTNSRKSLLGIRYRAFYYLPKVDTNYDLENIKRLLDQIYEERYE